MHAFISSWFYWSGVSLWVGWVLLSVFAVACHVADWRYNRGRARRRGGYIRPSWHASTSANPQTGLALRISTACRRDGLLSAVKAGPVLRRDLSSSGARGSFTSETGRGRGGLTTAADLEILT